MLQYVKFLHEIYSSAQDETKRKKLLRTMIRAEARLNNDIAGVISRTIPALVAEQTPELFQQFETSSFELLTSLGISAHEVFDEREDPSYAALEKLDRSSTTLNYFKSRPQSELYEFYIRKARLLVCLSRSNSIANVKIGLATRVKNLEYATRFLSTRLQ